MRNKKSTRPAGLLAAFATAVLAATLYGPAVGIAQQVTPMSLSDCPDLHACIWSDANFSGNYTTFGASDCSNWCGPIVGGFPFGIGSAKNKFDNRNFKVRQGTNGNVKCLVPTEGKSNLLNDGAAYTYVKVGPSGSGC